LVYVMSDIHGNEEKFDNLLMQIDLKESDTLYILGDIVDRGPRPIEILKRVMQMDNVKMLLGNHEHMMLQSYFLQCKPEEKTLCAERWKRNGCEVTIAGLNKQTMADKKRIYEYVKNLPLNLEIEVESKRYLLVHGFPEELFGVRESRFTDKTFFTVWERITKDDVMPEGKTVIFGHTSTDNYQECTPPKIWYGNNMIGIDCGGGYGGSGRISCLCLNTMQEFYA